MGRMSDKAKEISKIISEHTRPEDIERWIEGGFVDPCRIRVIVEMDVHGGLRNVTFRGTEYRVREDEE
jgi:hypothetical protein